MASDQSNLLLAALPELERRRVESLLRPVNLHQGDVFCEVGAEIGTIAFPTGGILSSVTTMDDGASIEGLLIGREGISGGAALFGVPSSPWRVVVQVEGEAMLAGVHELVALLPELSAFQHRVARYAHAMQQQATQSVACNRFHPIHERLARWLLMVLDRTGGNEVRLTHEFIADMLGTYRPSVTVAIATLERAGLVERGGRGHLTIPDRAALEAASCECYRRIVEYLQKSEHSSIGRLD